MVIVVSVLVERVLDRVHLLVAFLLMHLVHSVVEILEHLVPHYLLLQGRCLASACHQPDCLRAFKVIWNHVEVDFFEVLHVFFHILLNMLLNFLLQFYHLTFVVHVLQLVLLLSLEDYELLVEFVQLFLLNILKIKFVLDQL